MRRRVIVCTLQPECRPTKVSRRGTEIGDARCPHHSGKWEKVVDIPCPEEQPGCSLVWLCCAGVEETIDTRPGVSNSVNDRRPGLRYTSRRLEVKCDSTIERSGRTRDLRWRRAMASFCFRLDGISSSQNRSGSKSGVRRRFGKWCVVRTKAWEERGRAAIRCRPRPDCVELGVATSLRSLRPSLEISAHCSKMAYATVASLMQASTTCEPPRPAGHVRDRCVSGLEPVENRAL